MGVRPSPFAPLSRRVATTRFDTIKLSVIHLEKMAKRSSKLKAPAKFDPKAFLAEAGKGRVLTDNRKNQVVFSQRDPADAILYLQKGEFPRQ